MKLSYLVLSSLAALSIDRAQTGAAEAPAADAGGGAQVANLMSLEVTDKPLETVLQWISRRAGVNIVCNEPDQPRVTLRLVNVTWQEAVQQIAQRYDMVTEKKSERIWQLSRPPKVRMQFDDARLSVVLEALARQANVNIVISDDINSGRRLSMTLNGVPWREALDVIVRATGYAWIEQEYKIIRVVSKENVQKDRQTRVYRLNYTNGAAAKAGIAVALSDPNNAVYDARTNSLILTDTPPNLEAASNILTELDTRTREVQIEMKFVEFSTVDVRSLGFDPVSLGFDVKDFGRVVGQFSPFSPSATVGGYRMPTPTGVVNPFVAPTSPIPTSTGNISGALAFEAIASLNTTEILQTPTVLTLDNTKASILIGREIRFAEQTVTQENGVTKTTLKEAASSPVKDGINIQVTPHITSDGYVSIELSASDENATLQDFSSGDSQISLPQKTITSVVTTIMVGDGQTAVIGGILKNSVNEDDATVPGISQVPVLGWLFKKQKDDVRQRNLTLFITPRIIVNPNKDEMGDGVMRLREKISGLPQKPAAGTAQAADQSRTLSE